MTSLNNEQRLSLDIRRSILLNAYMQSWGMPEFRIESSRNHSVVEIYSFPPHPGKKVHRIATVGMSGTEREDGSKAAYEFLMTLPSDLAGASFAEVASFLMDVFAYSLKRDVRIEPGKTIPETDLMPASWKPRALLVDEARGEPEDFNHIHVGSKAVSLLWLVPIYGAEYDLIRKEGIEAFDMLDEKSEWSVADPNRPSLVGE